jgi:PAS domain S-box-containing protein
MAEARKESLKSENVFRLLVDSVRDYAILMLTPEGVVASWNPGAERIKGYTPEEIIGRHFRTFYPAKDQKAKKPEGELAIALETGRFEEEGWRLRKDGTRFWASVVIVPVRGDNGILIGFGKITRDLTRRREEEIRYRRLVEGVKDYAIYSLDRDGTITSWNVGAERIKQYKEAEIVGQNYATFYTPADVAAGLPRRNLKKAVEQGQFEDEGWRVRKDGARLWCSVVITPIHDEEGLLVGFTKITRDITDRKLLMDQIQQHAVDLEHQIAERDKMYAEMEAFSYSVSHDLRAPLRAIEGFTAALMEDLTETPGPEAQEDLAQITAATERMTVLINDLLEYSRLSRSQMDVALLKVEDLIAEVLKREVEGRSQIRTSIAPGLKIFAHKAALAQALLNLVDNALKFHQPGKPAEVSIIASGIDDKVRIEVRDKGIGLAEEHYKRIFQVFQRLHTSKAYPGTGIGLALVKRIVERLGGTVGVESQVGKGSTFSIEIPSA